MNLKISIFVLKKITGNNFQICQSSNKTGTYEKVQVHDLALHY